MARIARGVITLTDIKDGDQGVAGARNAVRYLYKETETDTVPDAPQATITWSTGSLSDITTGWSEEPPEVDATGAGRPWVSALTFHQASSSSQAATTTATGSTPKKGFTFDGVVTFSNNNLTDGSSTYDPANVVNSGTTTIDGGKITANSIAADRIDITDLITTGSLVVGAGLPTSLSDVNTDEATKLSGIESGATNTGGEWFKLIAIPDAQEPISGDSATFTATFTSNFSRAPKYGDIVLVEFATLPKKTYQYTNGWNEPSAVILGDMLVKGTVRADRVDVIGSEATVIIDGDNETPLVIENTTSGEYFKVKTGGRIEASDGIFEDGGVSLDKINQAELNAYVSQRLSEVGTFTAGIDETFTDTVALTSPDTVCVVGTALDTSVDHTVEFRLQDSWAHSLVDISETAANGGPTGDLNIGYDIQGSTNGTSGWTSIDSGTAVADSVVIVGDTNGGGSTTETEAYDSGNYEWTLNYTREDEIGGGGYFVTLIVKWNGTNVYSSSIFSGGTKESNPNWTRTSITVGENTYNRGTYDSNSGTSNLGSFYYGLTRVGSSTITNGLETFTLSLIRSLNPTTDYPYYRAVLTGFSNTDTFNGTTPTGGGSGAVAFDGVPSLRVYTAGSSSIFSAGDISVTTGTASGGGSLSYNNAGGFTFKPADLSSYATESYVNTAVSDLVDSSPATLDTLNELAAALGDDPNFATTTATSIGTKWTQDNTKITNWDNAYEAQRSWNWRWQRWAGTVQPTADTVPAWQTYYETYFVKRTSSVETSHPFQDDGYLNTINDVDSTGGFGGSTYGNMFGNLSTYHCLIYTNIYVDKEFTVNITNFSGDDPHAIFVDGKFVHGRIPCCSDTAYNYTFTQGWHRIDLIYSEGGGGDWIRMGWNPKDYLANISDMVAHRGSDNPVYLSDKINAVNNSSNWDTAYGWGNHASAGYLTSYSETDTLQSVTTRGATTNRNITTTGKLTVEDNVLEVGNKSADNYVEISQSAASSDFGFTFQHSNASLFRNLQGSTNQVLALGDVDSGADGTLLGVSILQSGSYYKRLNLLGNGTMYIGSGTDRVFADNYHPNADKWTTARTITLGGDLSGSVSLDGSANVTLSAQVTNNSHDHTRLSGFANQTEYDLIRAGNLNGLCFKARWDGSTGNRYWDMGYVDGYGTFTSGLKVYNGGALTYKGNTVFHDAYHPNADKWTTARTLSLTGDVTGSVSWDGSANASITTVVANDSHTHDGRYYTESEADSRFANITGDTFTGNLAISTASPRLTLTDTTDSDDHFISFRNSSSELHSITTTGSRLNINSAQDIKINRNGTKILDVVSTGLNVTGNVVLSNNGWYYSQYSASDDQVRFNANNGGGLDIYNQTQGAFANVRAGSFNVGTTNVIDSSRNLTNIGNITSSGTISGTDLVATNKTYIGSDNDFLRVGGGGGGKSGVFGNRMNQTGGGLDYGAYISYDSYWNGTEWIANRTTLSRKWMTHIGGYHDNSFHINYYGGSASSGWSDSSWTRLLTIESSGNTVFSGDLFIDKGTPRVNFKSNESGSDTGGRIELNENGNFWVNAQGGRDLWLNWVAPNSASSKADLNIGDGDSGSYIFRVEGSTRNVQVNGATIIDASRNASFESLSIGTVGGIKQSNGEFGIGSGSHGVHFNNSGANILPYSYSTNAWTNGVTDFGHASYRYKDGFFNGKISVNTLEVFGNSIKFANLNDSLTFEDSGNVYSFNTDGGAGNAPVRAGSYQVGTTTVIDSSRNFSGVNLSLTGKATIWTNDDAPLVLRQGQSGHPWNYIEFRNSGNDRNWYVGTSTSGNMEIQGETGATGGVNTNKYFNSIQGFKVGGTTVIDSSRNISNINQIRDNSGSYFRSAMHSGSDFTNGTLVTTNIPASASSGASFIIEVTGKSYSSEPPFSFIAQGYLYNNTIINYSGVNNGDLRLTYIKAMNNNGYLSFWWPRVSYWNSFEVHVRNANGDGRNAVTSIANSSDPSGATKKVTITFSKSVCYDKNVNIGNLHANGYKVGSTTVIDSSRNITGASITGSSLTVSGSGQYVAGSIYSDSNWGMLFRAKQASPNNAQYRWANSSDTELMRIDNSGNLDLESGGYRINGTTVIDSSRNLTGIADATIGTGSAKFTRYTSGNLAVPDLNFYMGGKTGWGVDHELGKIRWYVGDGSGVGARDAVRIIPICESGNGTSTTTFSGGLAFHTSAYNGQPRETIRFDSNGNLNVKIGSYQVNGTTVIDSSRNLTNIGSISASSTISGATRLYVSGLDTGNPTTASNTARMSGYGLLGNRGTFYLTNAGGDVQIGNGSYHAQNPTCYFSASAVSLAPNRNLQMNGTTVIDSSRNLTNIQSLSLNGSDGAIKQSTDTNKNLIIGSANTALRFINNSGQRRIIPRDLDDTAENGTIDLGDSGSKFRALYLSGGIYNAGSNVLDSSNNLVNIAKLDMSGNAIRSNTEFAFLTLSNSAQTAQMGGLGIGSSYSGYPAFTGGVNTQNGYQVGSTTVIDSSRNISARNATFDNGTSTTVTVKCDDAGEAVLNLIGDSQGTGRLFVGQSSAYGGGIEYNGDGTPTGSGSGSDYVTLFRRQNGTTSWTARNRYDNNNWEFRANVTASGNVTAYSDARLKDNVETLDGSKVYEMRGVSFTKDGELGSGVIAQELEQVAPELVMTNDDEMQTKSVAYGNVVGYLIEAIKELKQEIEVLKNGTNSN